LHLVGILFPHKNVEGLLSFIIFTVGPGVGS